jgi:hypothetical protein
MHSGLFLLIYLLCLITSWCFITPPNIIPTIEMVITIPKKRLSSGTWPLTFLPIGTMTMSTYIVIVAVQAPHLSSNRCVNACATTAGGWSGAKTKSLRAQTRRFSSTWPDADFAGRIIRRGAVTPVPSDLPLFAVNKTQRKVA